MLVVSIWIYHMFYNSESTRLAYYKYTLISFFQRKPLHNRLLILSMCFSRWYCKMKFGCWNIAICLIDICKMNFTWDISPLYATNRWPVVWVTVQWIRQDTVCNTTHIRRPCISWLRDSPAIIFHISGLFAILMEGESEISGSSFCDMLPISCDQHEAKWNWELNSWCLLRRARSMVEGLVNNVWQHGCWVAEESSLSLEADLLGSAFEDQRLHTNPCLLKLNHTLILTKNIPWSVWDWHFLCYIS